MLNSENRGIAIVALPKNSTPSDERTAREQAASLAVANALRIAPERCTLRSLDEKTGAATVAIADRTVRVQTAREKNVVVATTVCEA